MGEGEGKYKGESGQRGSWLVTDPDRKRGGEVSRSFHQIGDTAGGGGGLGGRLVCVGGGVKGRPIKLRTKIGLPAGLVLFVRLWVSFYPYLSLHHSLAPLTPRLPLAPLSPLAPPPSIKLEKYILNFILSPNNSHLITPTTTSSSY